MSKIKILEIIGDSSLAGAPRHLLSIIENLDLEKFEIHVICPPGPLAGEIKELRRHIDLDSIPMRSRLDFKAIKQIRRQIRHLKPDLIHIHGTRAGSLGRLAAIGFNIPVIYTEHLWTKNFRLANRFLHFFHHIANWFFDLFTTLNIAVSNAVKDFLVDSNISYNEKVKVIYNGIEPLKSQAKVLSGEEITIGTVATLNKNKGVQYLIRAWPRVLNEFPQARLEIIGDGPYKEALVKEVKKRKLQKHISFSGFLPDLEKELAKLDIYVQPSLSESFGLAIVQAMSVGLPIIATNTGGIPEVVTDNKSGLLVEPAKPKALGLAILDMLKNKEKTRKMGEMARKEATVRFNLKDMIKELEGTYEAVVQNPVFPK